MGNTIQGVAIDDISPYELEKLGFKPKAKKTAVKASKKVSEPKSDTLDLLWTEFVTFFVLVGRLVKFVWRNRVILSSVAFWVGLALVIALHYNVKFK